MHDGFLFHDKTATDENLETKLDNNNFPSPEHLWEKYKKYKGIVTEDEEKIVEQDYYDDGSGREQVISPYAEMPWLPQELVTRTRANYAGLVEMCDRWFGHLMETLRVTGVLDEALVIVTSDHGHSLWERRGYIGKRGYPSDPESYEVPLLVRHPGRIGAGTTCNAFVQHHDIAATMLDATGVTPPEPIDGRSFFDALEGRRRDESAGHHDETWSLLFDLNVRSMLNMVRATVPRMLEQGHGRIANADFHNVRSRRCKAATRS